MDNEKPIPPEVANTPGEIIKRDAAQTPELNVRPEEIEAMPSLVRAIKVVVDFYRELKAKGNPAQLIKDGLAAKGLQKLEGRLLIVEDLVKLLEDLSAVESTFSATNSPDFSANVPAMMESLRLKLNISIPTSRRAIIIRGSIGYNMHDIQVLLEALPRLAGISDVAHADAASDSFHEEVTKMYQSLGITYFPIRTFRDNTNSPSFKLAMDAVFSKKGSGVFPVSDSMAKDLARALPDLENRIIVSVSRPSYTMREHKDFPRDDLADGVVEYFQKPV